MKVLQSHFFRAITAIIVGILLVRFRNKTVTWMTMIIGALFLISGVISIATYYSTRKHASDAIIYDANGKQLTGQKPAFPIVGIGSIILGIILALIPNNFITALTLIFALILILGAINQFINLAMVKKFAKVGAAFWIFPSIILLVGLIALIKPSAIAAAPLVVIGWCMILYGVVECTNSIKAARCKKEFTQAAQRYHPQTNSAKQEGSTEGKKQEKETEK
ncbi:MAG: DUF308 domain-containing protein [Prevotella sp.]|jgi:uncharacterized membrane protein HdeD (DUF308 family)|nr:DUF308 domain-containing protein [Prevotella sp.]